VHSSITLGSEEVSPLDMVTIMATLANEGVRHDPSFVRRIDDLAGKTIYREPTSGTRVLDAELARTETKALREVITGGTGRGARIDPRPAAGKTGTTDNWHDAWFNGYTPQLATTVWMGSPVGQVPMVNVGGVGRVFGGTYPATIWAKYMRSALVGAPVLKFTDPNDKLWPKPRFVSEKGRTTTAPPGFRKATTTTGAPSPVDSTHAAGSPVPAPVAPPPTTPTTKSSPPPTKGNGKGG
jgi:penicillin-binding protein 1A